MEHDLEEKLYQRKEGKQLIKQQGYDIRDSVRELERLYGHV